MSTNHVLSTLLGALRTNPRELAIYLTLTRRLAHPFTIQVVWRQTKIETCLYQVLRSENAGIFSQLDFGGESCMSLTLYAHPFAAYCWKVLIALYENGTSFRYRMVEDAAGFTELEALWPLKKFPVLKDGDATVIESSVIIEHLMLRHPGAMPLIPAAIDVALKVRFLDRVFD